MIIIQRAGDTITDEENEAEKGGELPKVLWEADCDITLPLALMPHLSTVIVSFGLIPVH